MKIQIRDLKATEVFFENKFYPARVTIDVPFETALRMSKVIEVDFLDVLQGIVPKYDPELFQKENKFGFTSDIDQVSGWGNVTFNLLKYSAKDYKIALTGKIFNVIDRDLYKMRHENIEETGAMVWHEQPKGAWMQSPFAKNIAIVPFETTVIPHSWIKKINNFDALFVPCQQNAEAFRNSGVKIPIEVIHWGIDGALFKPIVRPERSTFTFGHMGALSLRKGTDTLIDAFREEFPQSLYPNVRLINKTSNPHYPFMVKDSRIIVQMMPIPHEELMESFFKEVDCFVFPTRGEGFGLTPLEAMATGIPAIVTGWSGPLEYMTPETGWLIDYKMAPATDFTKHIYKEECGEWAEPDKEHLKKLLRYAYEHQDEVKEKGKAAAEHVKNNWLWQDKIKMFHNALKKYL